MLKQKIQEDQGQIPILVLKLLVPSDIYPIGRGARLLMLCFPRDRAVVELYRRMGGHLAMKGATHDLCVSILMLGNAEYRLFRQRHRM